RTAIRAGSVGAAAGLLPAAHRTPAAGPLRRLPASGLPPGLSAAVPRLRPAALPRLRPTARLRPAVPGIRPTGLVNPDSTRSSYFWGPWGGEHAPCGPPFSDPWVNGSTGAQFHPLERVCGQPGVRGGVETLVTVTQLGPLDALGAKAGTACHEAGGRVVQSVPQFQPEQTQLGKSELRHQAGPGRGHTFAPSLGVGPVGHPSPRVPATGHGDLGVPQGRAV